MNKHILKETKNRPNTVIKMKIYLQPKISFIQLPIIGARIGAIVKMRPSKEYFFASSFPDNKSAIAALPQTVLTLPDTA